MRLLLSLALTTFASVTFAETAPSPAIAPNPVQDAQNCLDRLPANPSPREADECLIPIEGFNSPAAENIRCAVGFIREGFNVPSRTTDAFSALDQGPTVAGLQQFMSLLSFTSRGVPRLDAARASETFHSCVRAQGRGSALLAAFASIQMTLVDYLTNKGACSSESPSSGPKGYLWYDLVDCATTANPLDLLTLVTATTADARAIEAQLVVGDIVIRALDLSCQPTATNADLCGVLNKAVANAGGKRDARIVAVHLFSSLLVSP